MACMSPVKCRLISSIGTTCAQPPPAAPPFKPKTGPKDGSRNAIIVFLPIRFKASPNPTVVVDFPSPAFVGLMAVTRISLPSALSWLRFNKSRDTFALQLPQYSKSLSSTPILAATSRICSNVHSCAISKSVLNMTFLLLIVINYISFLPISWRWNNFSH